MPVAQDKRYATGNTYMQYVIEERETWYENFLKDQFDDLSTVKFLEIGAGSGSNIEFFKRMGLKANHILANELIPERVEMLRINHPDIQIFAGDATLLKPEMIGKCDVIFQSTVFTSILDKTFREKLAQTMMSLLSERGIILWYDFIFDNPSNPDVKKVTVEELRVLFPQVRWQVKKVTLAPPLGRRVGRMYPMLNAFPFLRTHIVAVGRA